jgi:WASH complex subunit 7
LDETLDIMKINFSERTDYLRLMVKNFTSIVESNDHKHLAQFYLIVPCLTINYIENLLISKEKLQKKNPLDAIISVSELE